MKRMQDWAVRLDVYLRASRTRAFAWGEFDCALFAAGGVEAMTERDFARHFRGKYKTSKGSVVALKKYGAGNLRETAENFLGLPLPSVLRAQRGDVIGMNAEAGFALGLVDLTGQSFAVVAPENGLSFLPLRLAALAWRV